MPFESCKRTACNDPLFVNVLFATSLIVVVPETVASFVKLTFGVLTVKSPVTVPFPSLMLPACVVVKEISPVNVLLFKSMFTKRSTDTFVVRFFSNTMFLTFVFFNAAFNSANVLTTCVLFLSYIDVLKISRISYQAYTIRAPFSAYGVPSNLLLNHLFPHNKYTIINKKFQLFYLVINYSINMILFISFSS